MIENNLLHEHSLFLIVCFRVQRNLFNYLWNLKTLISIANIKKDQQISAIWESQNVCLSECKKKSSQLWDLISIYRGGKTLKHRHGRLKCDSRRILMWKGKKECALSSPKGSWAKAQKGGHSALQKCRMVLLDAERSSVFGCVLDFLFRVFWSSPCT